MAQPVGGVHFKMNCTPSVLEPFMKAASPLFSPLTVALSDTILMLLQFKELQPFYLLVDIELQGMGVTTDDMQRYITAPAEIYASEWSHKPARQGQIFAHIQVERPVPLEWHEPAEDNEEIEEGANIIGELVIGWHEVDAEGHSVSHPTGFSAIVSEGLTLNGQHEDGEQTWDQAFPMVEVRRIQPEVAVANDVV